MFHVKCAIATSAEVAAALEARRPVVALESTLIAHGLPWPVNLQTALDSEEAVREAGAVPATVAVVNGRPTVGLSSEQIQSLATHPDIAKASRRDLALAVAKKATAATTVAGTMFLARQAGISIMATGGIGGVHRGDGWDISADLTELARTAVCVVCSGAKSILDLPRTVELLETLAVPVIGYCCDTLPAFYARSSSLQVDERVDTPTEAAHLLRTHYDCDGAGLVLAQPVPEELAFSSEEIELAINNAEAKATELGVRGKRLTPFLLAALADATGGRTLTANQALVVENARLAAEVARQLAEAK
jgi:pseudouridine-5'-phosphate glycosidase